MSYPTVRRVRPDDGEAIFNAIHEAIARARRKNLKTWQKWIDPRRVYVTMMTDPDVAVINDSILLYASHGQPWHSSTIVVEENLVLRIRPGNATVQDVTTVLDLLARKVRAAYIAVGTALSTNDDALARIYERHGYARASYELTKEVNYGQSH